MAYEGVLPTGADAASPSVPGLSRAFFYWDKQENQTISQNTRQKKKQKAHKCIVFVLFSYGLNKGR